MNKNQDVTISDPVLKTFIETVVPVIKEKMAPSKIVIFGSRVRGEATEDSDIDVIIVSDVFKGIKFVKRMAMVLKIFRFTKHVDLICYTPDEFEKIQNGSVIIESALSEGIFA
jgi:predicted nucleotidyltransferase